MGKRAPLILSAVVVLLLLGGSVALYSYDQGKDDQIAKGVTVAGIDVGGMTKAEATALLQRRLADPLDQPIRVRAAHHTFRLSAERSEVTTDVGGMVADAVAASRDGNLIQRSWRNLTGGEVHKAVQLKLTYNDRAVRSIVRRRSRASEPFIGPAPRRSSACRQRPDGRPGSRMPRNALLPSRARPDRRRRVAPGSKVRTG